MARKVLNVILRFLFKLFLRLEIEGLEKLPREGPVILMINHTIFLDPVIICAAMPRFVMPLAKREVYRMIPFGPLVWLYGVIPVRRGEVDRRALRAAIQTLKDGQALLVAPEGTRSHHGRLQPAKSGIAYIALRTQAPVLPVAIIGVKDFWHNFLRLRRTHVTLRLGRPFHFVPGAEKVTRQMLDEMTREAMYQLAALLPPEQRGVYSDLESATQKYLRFLPRPEEAPEPSQRQPSRRKLVSAAEG